MVTGAVVGAGVVVTGALTVATGVVAGATGCFGGVVVKRNVVPVNTLFAYETLALKYAPAGTWLNVITFPFADIIFVVEATLIVTREFEHFSSVININNIHRVLCSPSLTSTPPHVSIE